MDPSTARPFARTEIWVTLAPFLAAAFVLVLLAIKWAHLALPFTLGVVVFLLLQRNLRLAFIALIAVIPNLGEIEAGDPLALIWLVGFVPLASAWLLTLAFRPRELYLPLIPLFLMTLLLMVAIISHLSGYDLQPIAEVRQGGNWPWWVTVDAFVGLSIGVMAMSVFRDERELRNVYLAFIVSGIPYAITIFFFGVETDPVTGIADVGGRMQGFYGHPHMASTHMIVCALLAGNFAFYARGWMRWLAVASGLLFLTTLGFATSKTILAALPFVAFVWVAMMFSFRRAMLFVTGLLVTVALSIPLMPGSLQRDVVTIAEALVGDAQPHGKTLPGEGRLNTLKERFIQVEEGLRMVREEPWLGYGPGRVSFVSKIPARFAGPQIHNYYVQLFFEIGVIGGALFLLFVAFVLFAGFKNAMRLRGEPSWHLARGLFLCGLMIALVLALNSSSIGLRIVWALLGLLAGTEVLVSRPRPGGYQISS